MSRPLNLQYMVSSCGAPVGERKFDNVDEHCDSLSPRKGFSGELGGRQRSCSSKLWTHPETRWKERNRPGNDFACQKRPEFTLTPRKVALALSGQAKNQYDAGEEGVVDDDRKLG